ncbi:hypothetical protein GCM10009020_32830 [Natronoarchaeum mannanilyticum]|uniref:DUF8112 domain-containing protein n=1 Tax=Natronoarchaeum mannanilyticum TaxID=926360 RepID=A0AAV3TDT4_9EURY
MRATLTQLATGLRLADDAHVDCDDCGDTLRDGASIVVRLTNERRHWSVDGIFCDDCDSTRTLDGPGTTYVAARVGVTSDGATQSRWACLVDPGPIAATRRRPDD